MNDVTLRELKIVVEQAVRPVRATTFRKRKMREELLAHLASIFEEEVERLDDEQAALEQAKRRFGDPRALVGELQGTVPRFDRFCSMYEKVWRFEPGESWLHFAGKQFLFFWIPYVLLSPLVALPILLCGKPADYGVACHALFVTCIATMALMLPIIILSYEMGRSLYGKKPERSLRRAVILGAMCLPSLPLFAFLTYGLLTWDFWASLQHAGFACYFAPLGPAVIVGMSRMQLEERRYEEEWASLEIDS